MAKFERTVALCWILCFVVFPVVLAHAHDFEVGGMQGWTSMISNKELYEDWSDNQVFTVNDTLRFEYTEGRHNVLVVAESDYDKCFNQTPIEIHTDGDTRILLNRSGTWYFMCGFPGHCNSGQKFSADVRNASLTGSIIDHGNNRATVVGCSAAVVASLGLFLCSLFF